MQIPREAVVCSVLEKILILLARITICSNCLDLKMMIPCLSGTNPPMHHWFAANKTYL